MSRRVTVVVGLLLAFVAVGITIPLVTRARLNANFAASQNNLRELSFFAHNHVNPDPKAEAAGRLLHHIPAGTVVLPGVPPENRLSWVVPSLPGFNQKRADVTALLGKIDAAKPWDAEANQEAARTTLVALLCPENTPKVPPGSPAVTCYVGVAGLGADAATLPLPADGPAPPRAGAFRYDASTPFDRITDGLSQTLLFGETADAPGPWLRGGLSTVRAFDDAAGAKPVVGAGGQFGGYFPAGANFALCDGSVRMFSPRTTPSVLFRLATIAGGPNELGPVD